MSYNIPSTPLQVLVLVQKILILLVKQQQRRAVFLHNIRVIYATKSGKRMCYDIHSTTTYIRRLASSRTSTSTENAHTTSKAGEEANHISFFFFDDSPLQVPVLVQKMLILLVKQQQRRAVFPHNIRYNIPIRVIYATKSGKRMSYNIHSTYIRSKRRCEPA